MDINEFISNLSEVFEESDISKILPSTTFRDIPEWSSFIALSLIAMIDQHYNVKITGNEIREAKSIEDIFNTIKSKK
jgi:acyl carrier protein